jgi:DNA-binding XRE family transcriptional regulator
LMEYPSDQCNTHTPRVALPFLKITLNAPKPKPANYPANPKTLGEHIRKKRMDLGLLQRELAEIIGVNAYTIHNWECSHSRPQTLLIPKVIKFLNHNPYKIALDSPLYGIFENIGLSSAQKTIGWRSYPEMHGSKT